MKGPRLTSIFGHNEIQSLAAAKAVKTLHQGKINIIGGKTSLTIEQLRFLRPDIQDCHANMIQFPESYTLNIDGNPMQELPYTLQAKLFHATTELAIISPLIPEISVEQQAELIYQKIKLNSLNGGDPNMILLARNEEEANTIAQKIVEDFQPIINHIQLKIASSFQETLKHVSEALEELYPQNATITTFPMPTIIEKAA